MDSLGATFYSIIYGNIGQFVANLYQSGVRYKRRMAEIDEFTRFHGLSRDLAHKIHRYVDYAFSVTKGINVSEQASAPKLTTTVPAPAFGRPFPALPHA